MIQSLSLIKHKGLSLVGNKHWRILDKLKAAIICFNLRH